MPVTQRVRPSANTATIVGKSRQCSNPTKTDLNTLVSYALDNDADDRRIQQYHLSQAPFGSSARHYVVMSDRLARSSDFDRKRAVEAQF